MLHIRLRVCVCVRALVCPCSREFPRSNDVEEPGCPVRGAPAKREPWWSAISKQASEQSSISSPLSRGIPCFQQHWLQEKGLECKRLDAGTWNGLIQQIFFFRCVTDCRCLSTGILSLLFAMSNFPTGLWECSYNAGINGWTELHSAAVMDAGAATRMLCNWPLQQDSSRAKPLNHAQNDIIAWQSHLGSAAVRQSHLDQIRRSKVRFA